MEIKFALSSFTGIIILDLLLHSRLVNSSASLGISFEGGSHTQEPLFNDCPKCPALLYICISDTLNSSCITERQELNLISTSPSSAANISLSLMRFVQSMFLKVQRITNAKPKSQKANNAVYEVTSSPTKEAVKYFPLRDLSPTRGHSFRQLGILFDTSISLKAQVRCDNDYFGANCDLTVPFLFKGSFEKPQQIQFRNFLQNITNVMYPDLDITVKLDLHQAHSLSHEPVSQVFPKLMRNSSLMNRSQILHILQLYTGLWQLPAPIYTGKIKSFTTHIPNESDKDPNQPKPSKILYILFVVFLFATFLLTAMGFLIRHFRNKQRHIRMQNGVSSFSLTSLEDNAFSGKKGGKPSAEFCNPIYRYRSAEKSPHSICKNSHHHPHNHHQFRSAHQKHTKNKPSVTTMQEDIEDIADNSAC